MLLILCEIDLRETDLSDADKEVLYNHELNTNIETNVDQRGGVKT